MDTTNQTAYATPFEHLADMQAWVGKELGLSPWFKIDQARIDQFATATEDHQWIHTDPARSAKESPYQKTIAHGFLVLSLASKFAYETYSVADAVMGVNYGLDRVRFPNATPVDSEIRGRVSLLTFDINGKAARYKVNITFEIKGQSKPACVAEFIAMAYTA
ncbi:MAG: MaoC family dehydratase [Bacteroidota bacterium]